LRWGIMARLLAVAVSVGWGVCGVGGVVGGWWVWC